MYKLGLEKTEEADQAANICWIIEKAWEFQKSIYFCFIDCAKAFDFCPKVAPPSSWSSLNSVNF